MKSWVKAIGVVGLWLLLLVVADYIFYQYNYICADAMDVKTGAWSCSKILDLQGITLTHYIITILLVSVVYFIGVYIYYKKIKMN